jgi:hypothetical protein
MAVMQDWRALPTAIGPLVSIASTTRRVRNIMPGISWTQHRESDTLLELSYVGWGFVGSVGPLVRRNVLVKISACVFFFLACVLGGHAACTCDRQGIMVGAVRG